MSTRTRLYLATFDSLNDADDIMQQTNRASRDGSIFVVVEGPDDGDYSVVDLATAIDMDLPYHWSA